MTRSEYNSIVSELSERVFRYAFGWSKSEQDAKDLVQDVYTKLWENRKKVNYQKAKSWLFTCMHNTLVNFSKRKNMVDAYADLYSSESKTYQPDYALKDVLEKSLEQLSELQRSIVLLRDLEGYTYEEIGEILNLTRSQVRVYLFRARQKVKNQLKDLRVLVA